MTDLGNPFSERYEEIVDALVDRVRNGVEQTTTVRFAFEGAGTTYDLPETADDVTLLTGVRNRRPHIFERDRDFRFATNRIIWLDAGAKPDPASRFEVQYTYRERPAGLTDFNPGSVAGTLLRTVARQMTLLYDQMDEAYRRAFIDEATGVALDNVVALLGVVRNPALRATGAVTFSRRRPGSTPVTVAAGTRVADESGRTFVTTREGDFQPTDLAVTVPIEAVEPGPSGNVNARTITIMPTPPSGVDGVVNEAAVTGGQPPEPDDRLRERAKHALERAGNATLNAIKFAILGVEGVEGVEIADHSADDTVPVGEVRVRYSGGDRSEVRRAMEGARAAGILARLEEIERILISGTFYLIPEPAVPPASTKPFLDAATEAINALTIGAPLSVRRLNALAYSVPGLADVAEAQLEHDRGGEAGQPVIDPFPVGRSELVRADEYNLSAVIVRALRVAAPRDNEPNELDVQLVSADENPIEWEDFSIDVAVTLRARLRTAPTQPPERIGSLTKTLNFAGASTATLAITTQDVEGLTPGFRPDDHLSDGVRVALSAAAYPGLLAAEDASIDLPEGT